jgi:phage terminase Nu1 subunit (DNA packaging protein)
MPIKSPLVTACGTLAGSSKALYTLLHVGKGTLTDWRGRGAPAGLNLAEWHRWLSTSGRPMIAERIAPYLQLAKQAAEETEDETDDTATIDESVWKARRARAQAKREELALAEAEGKVVSRARAVALVRRLGQAVVEQIAPGIWREIFPALHAASPDTRLAAKRAHDAAILDLRQRLAQAAEPIIREMAQ